MILRDLMTGDIMAAAAVDAAAFDHAWDKTEFEAELAKDYSYYAAAEADAELCGYAGIWCIYETAELIRIAVNPTHQRQGTAALLMERLLSYAQSKGCERMMLEVRATNAAARALYAKFGFSCISVRKGYYDGEDALIMERIL